MVTTTRKTINEYVRDQREWIKKCGGSRGGYILRYGASDDPNKSGDGGDAIFEADQAELERLLDLQRRGRKFL